MSPQDAAFIAFTDKHFIGLAVVFVIILLVLAEAFPWSQR